jgi:GT2 family glycosyltransferase
LENIELPTMTDFPLIYVIILTWNGKADTLDCLQSLQNSTYPNARILVVDNASDDGTAEAVRSSFPNVELIRNDSNLRFAGGNNLGIEYSLRQGAEYVLLLNNDTVVNRDFLTPLVQKAEEDKQIGIVGPKIYYNESRRIWFAGGRIEWWRGRISHVGIREADAHQYDTPREVDYITGCCMLVKREVIDDVGTLDERFYLYCEEVDWCIRTHRAGYKVVYVPSSHIWHKVSASSGGHLSWFKNWNKLKSQLRLMARYARWYHWFTIPAAMMLNVIVSAWGALLRRDTMG